MRVYEGNLGEPTVSDIKSYKVKPKGMRLQRQSDEPIVAKTIETLKLYLCEGALL